MNDEQLFRLDSIKALSVDLLTAAHDQDEDRLLMVMAELTELFRVVRMDHDTRIALANRVCWVICMARTAKRRGDAKLEPDPPATRSSDALKDLAEAELMMQLGLSDDEQLDKVWPIPPEASSLPVPPEAFALDNPPVSDEPIDVVPRVFEIADDDDDEEAGTTDVEADLKMSGMYDASAKWV